MSFIPPNSRRIYVLSYFENEDAKAMGEDVDLAKHRYTGARSMRNVYPSDWNALGSHSVKAENLKLRSALTSALTRHIQRKGLTQAQAARVLGVTQPRISNLVRGKIDAFSLDLLVKMATAAGLRVSMKVKKAA